MNWTSRTGRRWQLRPREPARAEAIARSTGLQAITAEILASRGHTPESLASFLDPGVAALVEPSLLLGMDRALARIERALVSTEHIRLVTDYDVDGTTSCLILHAALDRLVARRGTVARISYHIPDRFTEGYGLSFRAVDNAIADGVSLLITADIGVRDHLAVTRAAAAGIDTIILDHHLPPGESVPPDAIAVLCPPQAGCSYPNRALAACGVSLKLATALLAEDPRRDEILTSMLKLAAIGTVADVVDLCTPENRAIVTLGLQALNRGGHGPGLQALIDVAGLTGKPIAAGELGFRIGPRINAAGRLADATAVVRLLRERDPAAAQAQARALDLLNRERQGIQEDMVSQALTTLPDPLPAFIVTGGPEADGWHRGVAGIVAARVRDRVGRPAAVVSVLGAIATGSIRSVPGVHAVRALDAAAHLLHRYGGHPVAAGFTLSAENLPAFAAILQQHVAENGGDDALLTVDDVDAVIGPPAVDLPLLTDLARLEPCGKGNPAPLVVVEGAFRNLRTPNQKHLFFTVEGVDAVWWGAGERASLLGARGSVLARLERNDWQGRISARLTVEDIA